MITAGLCGVPAPKQRSGQLLPAPDVDLSKQVCHGIEKTRADQADSVTYPAAVAVSGQAVHVLHPILAGFHRLVARLLQSKQLEKNLRRDTERPSTCLAGYLQVLSQPGTGQGVKSPFLGLQKTVGSTAQAHRGEQA